MKKMLFNDKYGLTDAVLQGRKTQTRRIIKPQPILDKNVGIKWKGHAYGLGYTREETFRNFLSCVKPPYQVGEFVAVAQPYKNVFSPDEILYVTHGEGYRMVKVKNIAGWNNKLYVCADLMPHQIRITNVRIEQLQDISDEECIKEGIREVLCVSNNWGNSATHTEYNVPYYDKRGNQQLIRGLKSQETYSYLIDKISGIGTWDSNSWVWAYEFELVK